MRELEPEVRDFLGRYVHSIEDLEVLLLLRAGEDREWSPEDVAARLNTSLDSARACLQSLAHHGLLTTRDNPAEYRYDPQYAGLDSVAQRVEQAYAARRVSVIEYIFSRPLQKIRSFADAFRLKEDKKE